MSGRRELPAGDMAIHIVMIVSIAAIMILSVGLVLSLRSHDCEQYRSLISASLRYDIGVIEAMDITQQGPICLATVVTYNATTQTLQRDIVALWEVGELHPDKGLEREGVE